MKKSYVIADRAGHLVKTGLFTEPEVRMAAKAGMRVFARSEKNRNLMEITQELTGLFKDDGRPEG